MTMPARTARSDDPAAATVADRIDAYDWAQIATQLDETGFAVLAGLLDIADCDSLRSLYDSDAPFRKRVVMERHGYGRGEYKYFTYPLPPLVTEVRTRLYPRLVGIANRWQELLRADSRFPADHAAFLDRCHGAGQAHATPLLLRYGPGDYNCLHQDLYGEHVFPLQVAALLSQPQADFSGGEFVLTEQRPRMQSRPAVVPLHRGDAVIFGVHHRPVHGTRGYYRVTMRHGVSTVRTGQRFTAGIIFHDAQK